MRKLFILVICLGMLTIGSTAIAESIKCSLIPTQITTDQGESHYINPKHISSLTVLKDTASVATGNSGRYILFATMTNGDNIHFGTYKSDHLRKNAIKFIYQIVRVCNK